MRDRRSIRLPLVGALLSIILGPAVAQPQQIPLPAAAIPQFIEPLPTLSVGGGTLTTVLGNQPLTIRMCEVWANVLPTGNFAPGWSRRPACGPTSWATPTRPSREAAGQGGGLLSPPCH